MATTDQVIRGYLAQLDWMIRDEKRELANAAQQMIKRAEEAVKETEAMMADQPCSLMWVEFAEGDFRKANESKTRLNQLLDKHKILTILANKE